MTGNHEYKQDSLDNSPLQKFGKSENDEINVVTGINRIMNTKTTIEKISLHTEAEYNCCKKEDEIKVKCDGNYSIEQDGNANSSNNISEYTVQGEVYSCMEPVIYDKNNNNITVLVTGATGFIASHVVERLLLRGYKVRATTRSKNNQNSDILLDFHFANENLTLCEAELLNSECWKELVKGCNIVIHCASPYKMDCSDPYEIINPAIIGTKNVIHACCMCDDVKTVVLTSSIAAVVGAYKDGKVYSEIDWNDDCDPLIHPYLYSKVEAEKIAYKVVDECRKSLNLIVVNPGMVIGPSYRNEINQSVQWIYNMITGRMPLTVDLQTGWVDVRDVAEIHIRLFESGDFSGRFICIEGMYTFLDVSRMIKHTSPQFNPPNHCLPTLIAKMVLPLFASKNERDFLKISLGKRILLSNGRLLSHFPNYRFLPTFESVKDTCNDLSNKFDIKK
ncbi:cinnamyl-alcohol dehydrogenase-like nucleoside diphosphate sugar epimerase [Cryptosporidium ubiquitum]|uniref:Cinnamyl-alcohol dehydrogenase-like nucleoside diphosphate sugar epimerase n=1 Tax=Cryptosporidium ubiquitum TaxID=857276 RepID=A0A1J4MAS2_9CRYT|nr:cinnamyl-alcohol dehydrogenase-like nucleoside diphosphate sugar epimerase [Cryptosporidium ubiquitum]OII71330.1 cinnamyl-alcohol dehydrogenase-like nucleoside diphosphate sugar epimerase [Cryptosporidium ubiquitum]